MRSCGADPRRAGCVGVGRREGEVVVVVDGADASVDLDDGELVERLRTVLAEGSSKQDAVDRVVAATGARRGRVYDLSLRSESSYPQTCHTLFVVSWHEHRACDLTSGLLCRHAALGLGAGLFIARNRAEGESASLDGVVERVVSVAGESFDSRLQTGTAELEHRRQAIDDHLEGVVKSLAEKIDSVDKLVAERVVGMSETVGERVGGMSKSLGHQVQAMGTELTQLRNLVGQLQKRRPTARPIRRVA